MNGEVMPGAATEGVGLDLGLRTGGCHICPAGWEPGCEHPPRALWDSWETSCPGSRLMCSRKVIRSWLWSTGQDGEWTWTGKWRIVQPRSTYRPFVSYLNPASFTPVGNRKRWQSKTDAVEIQQSLTTGFLDRCFLISIRQFA